MTTVRIPLCEIIPPGTPVIVGKSIDGLIVAVEITHGYTVRYEVTYWDGNSRCSAWFLPQEITVADPKATMPIGFRT